MSRVTEGIHRVTEGIHVEDFLHPKSMLTPAAAGAITALIAGALFKNFDLAIKFGTIGISFLIGLIVLQSRELKSESCSTPTKAVMYVLNSLIIFAVATGTTSVMAEEIIDQRRPLFYDWTEPAQKYPELTNSDYELTAILLNKEDEGFIGWLQKRGVLAKDYQTKIVLEPKNKAVSLNIKDVKIAFPEKEFDNQKVKLSSDQLPNGVNINAWKGFQVETEITTKSGENIKLHTYIIPQNL